MRFAEGGNGAGSMAEAHLNPVPMVLGNFGDFSTLPGVMAGVRTALERGTLYSPHRCSRLLPGSDNFVCKLYPFTVVRLASGTVIGRERLVSMHSGTFRWPGAPDGAVRLYVYTADGVRDGSRPAGQVENGAITFAVPPGGLVIAER